MAEIDEKLAELEGFSDYIREYQVGLNQDCSRSSPDPGSNG